MLFFNTLKKLSWYNLYTTNCALSPKNNSDNR